MSHLLTFFCFLSAAIALQMQPLGGSCECLMWGEAYTKYGVTCGQGFELVPTGTMQLAGSAQSTHFLNKSQASASCPDGQCEWCFIQGLDDNAGVNVKGMISSKEQGAWYDKSWCYTSSACDDLNGGSPVSGTQVSYKFIEHGKGRTLRALSVQENEALARKSLVDFGMFPALMGYTEVIDTEWSKVDKMTLNNYIKISYNTTVTLEPPNHGDRLIIHQGKCFNSAEMPKKGQFYNPLVSWHATPVACETKPIVTHKTVHPSGIV